MCCGHQSWKGRASEPFDSRHGVIRSELFPIVFQAYFGQHFLAMPLWPPFRNGNVLSVALYVRSTQFDFDFTFVTVKRLWSFKLYLDCERLWRLLKLI